MLREPKLHLLWTLRLAKSISLELVMTRTMTLTMTDDDSKDEDNTPTEDARNQNILSPTRRNTNANESSKSPKDDTLDD